MLKLQSDLFVINCARFLQSLQDTDKRDNGGIRVFVSSVEARVELETGEYIRRLQEGDEESEVPKSVYALALRIET